jgi:hypothetical protein
MSGEHSEVQNMTNSSRVNYVRRRRTVLVLVKNKNDLGYHCGKRPSNAVNNLKTTNASQ